MIKFCSPPLKPSLPTHTLKKTKRPRPSLCLPARGSQNKKDLMKISTKWIPNPNKFKNTAKTSQNAVIKLSPTMPMECARTATTLRAGQRKPTCVLIRKGRYMQKVYAKTATWAHTTRPRDLMKNSQMKDPMKTNESSSMTKLNITSQKPLYKL